LAEVRVRVVELAELAEAPELLSGLDEILRELRLSPARSKTITKATSSRVSRPAANKKSRTKKAATAKKVKKR